jgi:uncharacterized protein (DUF736 family)
MNDTKTESKWGNREMGALWLKLSKDKTQKYMTGHINSSLEGKIDVVIFSNKEKKNEKSPDFRIYASDRPESKPKEAAVSATGASKNKTTASTDDDDGVL